MSSRLNPYVLFTVIILFVFDGLMIGLHLYFNWQYSFFNLDQEHNLPTTYQGLKYILLAAGCAVVAYTTWIRPVGEKFYAKFWGLLATGFAFLSVDEMGLLHENVERHATDLFPSLRPFLEERIFGAGYAGASWLIFYVAGALVLSPLLLYMAVFAYRKVGSHATYLVLGAVLVVLAAAGLEFLSTSGQATYNATMLWEESFELIGVSLAGLFVFEEVARRTARLKG